MVLSSSAYTPTTEGDDDDDDNDKVEDEDDDGNGVEPAAAELVLFCEKADGEEETVVGNGALIGWTRSCDREDSDPHSLALLSKNSAVLLAVDADQQTQAILWGR